MMKEKTIGIKGNALKISNSRPLTLIAGPCVLENEKMAFLIASKLKEISSKLKMPLVFKGSYDKANRSSIKSFRGPGLKKGLEILAKVKKKYNLPVITDVHCREDVKEVAKVVDIIQIPAFLARQTDLIVECAKTGLPVNVKKAQFMAPRDMVNVINKIQAQGNSKIVLTERGTSFGYNNLVTDIRSLVIMKETGCPIIFDATHSVQTPGGMGTSSGGQREFIKPLSQASVSVGIAGIFLEVHPNPEKALSDGPNSIKLSELKPLLSTIVKIDSLVK